MAPYRIIIADDHALFRQGLKRLLEDHPDVEIIGEGSDGMQLLDLLTKLSPDLILLDISMPNLRGIEAISEIKKVCPDAKILILTMHKEYLYESIAAGVDGYFLKGETDTALFSAIEKVRRGEVYVPLEFSEQSVRWAEMKQAFRKAPLTSREKEILKLIADGKPYQEIAKILYISAFTVKRHRTNILVKLNLKTNTDLVKYALQKGYV